MSVVRDLPRKIQPPGKSGLLADACVRQDSPARYSRVNSWARVSPGTEEVEAARERQDYKDAYRETKQELENKPKGELAGECAATLEQLK